MHKEKPTNKFTHIFNLDMDMIGFQPPKSATNWAEFLSHPSQGRPCRVWWSWPWSFVPRGGRSPLRSASWGSRSGASSLGSGPVEDGIHLWKKEEIWKEIPGNPRVSRNFHVFFSWLFHLRVSYLETSWAVASPRPWMMVLSRTKVDD